ncbi:transposable element-derived 1-like [Octopus vulgaris]|uniref:Transposable element-derived 1-like n=1 Tax=Octopus vulgaris TaxID=6645 RepID=A0AA36AQQ9_OCTVU|nr:transposable element-derived 1-like [Octopus vulgaris]
MAPKHAASSKAGTEPKCKQRMMTIGEKVKLLDMLKEGRTFAAVAYHFSMNESTVRYIKKDEANIRKMAVITYNKSAKRIITACNETIIHMEAALAVWIANCRKKNIALDMNIIQTKARSLYETFAAKDDSGEQKEEEEDKDDVEDPQTVTSCDSQSKKRPFLLEKSGLLSFRNASA